MWGTVLLMGALAGVDPVRVGMVAFMLGRPRPVPLLIPFAAVGVTLNVVVGAVLLFVSGRVEAGGRRGLPAQVEIAIGVLALVIAVTVLARARVRVRAGASAAPAAPQPPAIERLPGFARLPHRVRAGLRGDAAWVGWFLGLCMGFPTPYYLAALAAVLTAGVASPHQAAALVVFNLIGFAAALTPIVSFTIAPDATRRRVSQVYGWMGVHHRAVVVTIAVVVGVYFIVTGWRHL